MGTTNDIDPTFEATSETFEVTFQGDTKWNDVRGTGWYMLEEEKHSDDEHRVLIDGVRVAATGHNEFGSFLSLGVLSKHTITLARRYVDDNDYRSKLSPEELLDGIDHPAKPWTDAVLSKGLKKRPSKRRKVEKPPTFDIISDLSLTMTKDGADAVASETMEELTPDQLNSMAVASGKPLPTTLTLDEFGALTFTAENGEYFTVKEMINAIEKTQVLGGDLSDHEIIRPYFEDMHADSKFDPTTFRLWWGS